MTTSKEHPLQNVLEIKEMFQYKCFTRVTSVELLH